MQLSDLPSEIDATIFNLPLEAATPAKVYYCYRGRNAYYGVWVTHYNPGCMHTSFDSAKYFIEPQRAQGSVFYVKELPALLLTADRCKALVTQINTDMPLSAYAAYALPERDGYIRRVAYGTEPMYLCRGMSLFELIRTFQPNSNFWLNPPPPRNSVVILYSFEPELEIEPLTDEPLRLMRSFTRGQDCYLGWKNCENSVKRNAIVNLSALFEQA